MQPFMQPVQQRPLIALHVAAALALVAGSVVTARPKGTHSHRTLGWAFVALLSLTALSSVFIRDHRFPNIARYTPIHQFAVATAIFLPLDIWHVRHGHVQAHRRTMRRLFIGACVVAGLFTLLPGRFLGDLPWKQGLGMSAVPRG